MEGRIIEVLLYTKLKRDPHKSSEKRKRPPKKNHHILAGNHLPYMAGCMESRTWTRTRTPDMDMDMDMDTD